MASSGFELRRKFKAKIFKVLCLSAVIFSVLVLFIILYDIFSKGFGNLNFDFLSNFPSRFPAKAGLKSAIFGTLWLISITALICIPISIATAIYLEEYASKNWFYRFIQININNLAGVPSIIYGILGLAVFVRWMQLGESVLAGALTMALLVMPIIITTARESLQMVPKSLTEASYALGATKWQTIRRVVLPSSLSGMMTGIILALSRAIGEAAPLIIIGALAFVAFTPSGPMDSYTVLSIQIFNWISRPQEQFHQIAASGIIVLLIVLFAMNSLATFLRHKYQNKFER